MNKSSLWIKPLDKLAGSVLLIVISITSVFAAPISFRLDETIDLAGANIRGMTHIDQNLVILNNGYDSNDSVSIYDLQGTLIQNYAAPTAFSSGITYNGNDIIFGSSTTAGRYQLRTMDPTTGIYSAPLTSPLRMHSLGFDGTNILVAGDLVFGTGTITTDITFIDSTSFNTVDTISVTIDTEGNGSPTGMSWHNDNLFMAFSLLNQVFQLDESFNVIQETQTVANSLTGLTFIGDDMFVGDKSPSPSQVHRYTPGIPDPPLPEVPIPPAVWLFGSGLLGLIGFARRKNA